MSEQPKVGGFCWTELATSNVQAAKDFYGSIFGWKFSDHDMGDMTYTMIKLNEKDDKEFGGMWAIPKEQEKHIPPHWMSYILVANIDESLEKARKQGASIVRDVANVGNSGRFAIITDPTGAHVALWQSTQNA